MTDSPAEASEDTTAGLFRLRDFRFYISGRFLGTLAMLIQSVAVGWQVYDITESAELFTGQAHWYAVANDDTAKPKKAEKDRDFGEALRAAD